MDATPVRLGQEFGGYASQVEHGIRRLRNASEELAELALGGTAVGTGTNAVPGFPRKTIEKISALTGLAFREAEDHFEAQGAKDACVSASGALNTLAVSLLKIANDIRWLASGPTSGLAEITFPAIQPGSSIMPGKVNPVVPEVMNLVAFRVMGNDYAVTLAAHSGQLQLNAYEPLEGVAVMESQHLLYNTSILMRTKCIDGITVNEKVLAHYMETTVGIVTALNPILGYEKATELAQEAYSSGKGILEIIREKHILTEQQIQQLLDPAKLTGLDKSKYQAK
jgi:fumarate hydratase class II